jgi:putative FmdB family regulatory protein
MPTYEYKCAGCGHQFEQFQSMKDKTLRKCPKCGKAKLERLIGTGAAVIFKGSGFYQTDYRSEGYKKSAEADKKPAETPASADKAKSAAGTKADGPAKPESAPKAEPAAKPAPPEAARKDSSKSGRDSGAKKKSKRR